MEKDKMTVTLEKIESLIIDGQKELLGKLGQVESRLGGVETRIGHVETRIDDLDKKIDQVHDSLKTEIVTTAKVLDYDIKEIGRKLDEHMRQPVHA